MNKGDRVVCIGFTPSYEGLRGVISRVKKGEMLVHFDKGFSSTIPGNCLKPEETPWPS